MFKLFLFLGILALPFSAQAMKKPSGNNDICHSAVRVAEQKYNIPKNLLRAISLTESGRWQSDTRENIAWPWTVTSGGPGEFFPNRKAALDHVRTLQAQGRTNIDVGCMQINLRYHPDAFENMVQAFDPYQNADYAARFLTKLFHQTKSWTQAAGRYHTSEPMRNMRYREKVMAFWNFSNEKDRKDGTTYAKPALKSYRVATIDHQRTHQLNNSFRQRLNAHRKAEQKAQKMSKQISQWRNSRGLSNALGVNVARQKALHQQKQKKMLTLPNQPRSGLQAHDFSKRRSAQLDKWRRTKANPALFD